MEKKKMVMLPSEKAIQKDDIVKYVKRAPLHDDECETVGEVFFAKRSVEKSRYWEKQHLYIVDTQATIKVGDVVYSVKENSVFISPINDGYIVQERELYKVVATTDPPFNLPTIPEQLVKEYVEYQFEYVPDKYICRKCGGLAIDSKALMNYHYIDKSYIRGEIEFETKLEDCLKCMNCGHSWVNGKEKSARELALEWWNNLSQENQINLQYLHKSPCRHPLNAIGLTVREIEEIWMHEIVSKKTSRGPDYINEKGEAFDFKLSQTPDKPIYDSNGFIVGSTWYPPKPQVDFEMLKLSLKRSEEILKDSDNEIEDQDRKELKNLLLFFNMLKKSSSFAHKAHKTLRN